MQSSESGQKMVQMIKKAISDCKLTTTEYEEILTLADDDGIIDKTEKNLLNQLNELIANGTVKRVPG